MKVEIELLEDMLGTASGNPKVHEEFVASKSKDADKVAEELAALPADEKYEKAMTVFHRDYDGTPILFDYQVKGFLKEAIGVIVEFIKTDIVVGKTKLSKWTHKRVVDKLIFVHPRRIRLANLGPINTRPLKCETMQGPRVSLASSETVEAGTKFVVEIETMSDSLMDIIPKALDYGTHSGLGQWRNAGWGSFKWREIKD